VDVRLTLARAYQELGLFNELEAVSREAARVAKAHWGDRHERVAEALISQGYAFFQPAPLRTSPLRLTRRHSGSDRRCYGENHPLVALSCHRVGIALLFKAIGRKANPLPQGTGYSAGASECQNRAGSYVWSLG